MVYGYLRVSTDKQDYECQKIGVDMEAAKRGLAIDKYIIDDGISGAVEPEKRKLGKLIKKLKPGDVIIASEISRLGRTLFMIMRILELCMAAGAKVYTAKDSYELGDNIQSKVLAFAFGLAAEIERNLISQRTREGLARARAAGKTLGRPAGTLSANKKLIGCEKQIMRLLSRGHSKASIARRLKVNRRTLRNFINYLANTPNNQ